MNRQMTGRSDSINHGIRAAGSQATSAMREADAIQARRQRFMFGALAVLALMLFATTTVLAAGTETTTSSSTSYTVSNPTKAMRKATALINAEDYRAALVHLETEVAANPKNADAWNLTGFAARKLGDYGRSETAYDTALTINPKHAGALEYKGELYLTLGNLEGAQTMLARLKDICAFNCNEVKALNKAINLYKQAN